MAIGQRQSAGEVVIALTLLELVWEGLGVLRYRIAFGKDMFEGGYSIPESELIIRDESGRKLSWLPRGASASEADGEVETRDLPERESWRSR